MYNIQKAIRASRLPKRDIARLRDEIKKEFPNDTMLYELHLIRALRSKKIKLKSLQSVH